jgi:hypothetical protein
MFPGAFREGGRDIEQGYGGDEFTAAIEEEDEEQTLVATREQSINPISATLVDAKEEEMRLQEKINQALQRERQQAVVAQVAPGNRRRKWFVIGTIFLIVVALTTALALTLPPPSPSNNCGKDGYFGPKCTLYLPNCSVDFPDSRYIGDGFCDGLFNTTECGMEGGDCLPCNDGYVGINCKLFYPNCSVPNPQWIGDGACDGDVYNTEACGWDGKDCRQCDDGYFGPNCTLYYPNCSVPYPEYIADGICDGDVYNTEACGWDGTDCGLPCDDGYFGPNCTLYYPNCSVPYPEYIGDGTCDRDVYNTEACGWDGTDCGLPCDNDGYFGPNCTLYYPNCSVPSQYTNSIGDGFCNDFYNTTECGNDGGDCLPCKDGYIGFNCTFYLPILSRMDW